MVAAEQPITRSELRDELQLVLQHYATKADVAEVRGELKAIRWTISLMGIGLSVLMVAMRFLDVS